MSFEDAALVCPEGTVEQDLAAAPSPETPSQTAPAVHESEQDPFALASAAFADAGSAPPAEEEERSGQSEPSETAPEPAGAPETPDDELARLRTENEQLKGAMAPPSPPKGVADLRRFTGLDPIHEGGPTLEQIARMADERDYRGLNELRRPDGSYGYSLEEALDVKRELLARQHLISNTSGIFHDMAWSAIGAAFDQTATELGLDPAELAKQAAGSGSPLAVSGQYLGAIKEAAFKAGKDAGVKEWKAKHDSLHADFEAYKAQAAGSAAGLESGGRGQHGRGGFERIMADAARDEDEFVERAIRGEYAGLDLSDR